MMATQVENKGEKAKVSQTSATVTVPVIHNEGGYVQRHIEVNLPTEHAQTLRDVFDGLHSQHAKLKNGRHVDTPVHALLYLIENLKVQK